jgi:branched-chain amino acid transport system ATP-binding protein
MIRDDGLGGTRAKGAAGADTASARHLPESRRTGEGGAYALAVDGLSSGYAGAAILHDVSFTVSHAQVAAVLGRNGAGKTTLLRCISGLIPARSGSVSLNGGDITKWSPYRRVAAGVAHVPEGRRMVAGLTVRENLLVGGYVLSRKELVQQLDRVLTSFPLVKQWLHLQAFNLSGGQQQLVAAARALMSPAKLLMLDEPLTGLAPSIAYEVLDVIRQLRDEGRTVLIVEQNAHMALEVADSAFVLDRGRLTSYEHGGGAESVQQLERGYLGMD